MKRTRFENERLSQRDGEREGERLSQRDGEREGEREGAKRTRNVLEREGEGEGEGEGERDCAKKRATDLFRRLRRLVERPPPAAAAAADFLDDVRETTRGYVALAGVDGAPLPLLKTLRGGRPEILQAMLEGVSAVAAVSAAELAAMVNSRCLCGGGRSLLFFVGSLPPESQGHAIDVLVRFGADLEHRDDAGYTALHWAASGNGKLQGGGEDNAALLQALLSRGANPNTTCDTAGRSPLHAAAQFGDARCIQLLLDFAADLEPRDTHGFTPLMLAGKFGYPAGSTGLATLLERGADPRATDVVAGRNALHAATADGSVACVRSLLCCDYETTPLGFIDPDWISAVDAGGNTPLHDACYELTHWTPLMQAADFREIALLLVAAGVDESVVNRAGRTALDLLLPHLADPNVAECHRLLTEAVEDRRVLRECVPVLK